MSRYCFGIMVVYYYQKIGMNGEHSIDDMGNGRVQTISEAWEEIELE